jgi:hypothetical protein
MRNALHRGIPVATLQHYRRINLLATIPELNLVVAGSQDGRVALLSLTKMNAGNNHPVVMFRMDYVLPFTDHETFYRPLCPLLGLAVSPLQTGDSRWDDENEWRNSLSKEEGELLEDNPCLAGKRDVRRWRLILHVSYSIILLLYNITNSGILEVFRPHYLKL